MTTPTEPGPAPQWQPPQGYQQPMPPGWQQYQQPPPRRKWGPLKVTGIGCGGLLLLIFVVTVVGAAAGSGGGGGSSPGSSPAGAEQAVSAGQVAYDGDFAFRYKGMLCGAQAANDVYNAPDITGSKPAGTRECIIELKVTDDKSQAQTFFDSDQYAYDASGRQFTADDNGTYLTGDKDDTQINPDVSITALVPFNIPAGDQITRLVLHDSEFSGGVTVNI